MIVFFRQFFSSEAIAQVWDNIFLFIETSPLGVLCSICFVSFVVFMIGKVIFR